MLCVKIKAENGKFEREKIVTTIEFSVCLLSGPSWLHCLVLAWYHFSFFQCRALESTSIIINPTRHHQYKEDWTQQFKQFVLWSHTQLNPAHIWFAGAHESVRHFKCSIYLVFIVKKTDSIKMMIIFCSLFGGDDATKFVGCFHLFNLGERVSMKLASLVLVVTVSRLGNGLYTDPVDQGPWDYTIWNYKCSCVWVCSLSQSRKCCVDKKMCL